RNGAHARRWAALRAQLSNAAAGRRDARRIPRTWPCDNARRVEADAQLARHGAAGAVARETIFTHAAGTDLLSRREIAGIAQKHRQAIVDLFYCQRLVARRRTCGGTPML